MKTKFTLFALLCALTGLAQAPAGYYSTATGTGYTLKTQLYNIIKGHTDRGYSGLWTTYSTSDRDNQYENDNSIIDVYSENPTGTDPYKFTYSTSQCGTYSVEGDCYNREHMIPQSVFNSVAPMVSDAHFIPPTDGKVNGMRSNYPHGNVATASWTSKNGGKLGSSAVSGYSGTVFEPINEFKGDIARMYFYFATRYENTVAGYPYDMFNGTSNQVFTTAFRDMLLAWHAADPVSAREVARNNAIYARQGNRNPFIDNPSYVNMIWGGGTADTTAPTVPANLASANITSTSFTLSWSAATDNVGVTGYDVYQGGVLKTSVTATSASITGLTASTAYSFTVKAKDAAGNTSASSTALNVTTSAATATYCASKGGSVADEYIGRVQLGTINNSSTGNNGYTDFTGISTNLTKGGSSTITITPTWTGSAYPEGIAVWIDYNNDKDFDDSGELIYSRVASTATPASGNFTVPTTAISGSTRMRVSMKYNGVPTTCESFQYGEVEDYTVNLTTTTADTTAPTVPTGLTASNVTSTGVTVSWTASTDNIGIAGYDVYQNGVLKTSVTGTSASIIGLTASTAYSFTVKAKDAAGNISASSTALNVTTSASASTITELYFSEYLEGSSNNKALEITNSTGASINLSAYTIKKQTNGAGSWSTGLTLSGTLANNGKFVLVNSSISSACYSTATANLSTAATELAFNGNDAVGLFKNGTLIDLIGTFNGGTADFAIDQTLRRKTTVTVPRTSFNKTTDWDIYTTDTCSGLGNRIASSNTALAANIRMYPNPSNGNFEISFEDLTQKYSVEVYSILGQKVYEIKNIISGSVSVNNLNKGIYLVKVNQNDNSMVKQVIVE
ncbi:endonuclease [Flavobacterium sp. H122]|uniref:endonuclease n=1 Tax=Flavobacterium sp. H122 TaxID=2529860 RepID=UPI0010AA6E4C|nr:endonuclease [Flavobacterium sp. H122]